VFHEQQATKLTVNPGEVEARSAAIGDVSRDVLDAQFAKLGKTWESQAEGLLGLRTKELKNAQAEIASSEQATKVEELQGH